MISVPHQCMAVHKWNVLLPYGYYYPDPSKRFCKQCLEWNRIEVASIQLETWMDSARIERECPICSQRTIIPLFIDLAFSGMSFVETPLEDMFVKKLRWYHLPKRWPVMCEHSLEH